MFDVGFNLKLGKKNFKVRGFSFLWWATLTISAFAIYSLIVLLIIAVQAAGQVILG